MKTSSRTSKNDERIGKDPFFDKGLPNDVGAERSILGAILLDNSLCDEVETLIAVDDLFLDSHRRILSRMLFLRHQGQPIDEITLPDALRRTSEFEQIGGLTYIASLIDGVPRTDTIEPYAEIVIRKSKARQHITAANLTLSEAFDDPDDPELSERVEKRIMDIAANSLRKPEIETMYEAARRYVVKAKIARDSGDRITGLATGLDGWDGRTLGLQRQELVVIAGETSVGKTTLSQNIAHNIVNDGYRVFYWSGEMPNERISEKAIAKEEFIDSFRMRTGDFDERRVDSALKVFAGWDSRFSLCDKPRITVAQFRSLCRWLKRRQGLDVAIGDYLGLFAYPAGITDDFVAVTQNIVDLKTVARELDISVVILSQMNRQHANRSDKNKSPQLSDLRGSGRIEEESDVVAFIYRDFDAQDNISRIKIAKNRLGPVGKPFNLVFLKNQNRFENVEEDRKMFNDYVPEEDES